MWTGGDSQFTMSGDLDWAFCVPFSQESCRGWALYVSGKFDLAVLASGAPEEALKGHMRFAELVAQFIGAIRQVRALQYRHDTMRRFFSPAVVDTLSDKRLESALAPREGPVSVLFCDVRAFSHHVERARDRLHEVLNRISEALGVMTRSVMAQQGVIADFQGDAVLAFWGWPTRLEAGPLAACRAALAIHDKFLRAASEPGSLLAGFQVGIGIGHGPAIAGQIGTDDQVKIGVFGPVVNLTSRLDGISRQFGVTIVVDEATAQFIRQHMPPGESRCRRLGRVRPKGMAEALLVSELLPSTGPELYGTGHLEAHERAVDAFMRGDWLQAKTILGRQTAKDGAKDFLLAFMAGHGFTPPPDWDGVVALSEK
jgi:adenylate cyclase